ncbi:MAG: chloride channel protein [Nitrospinota bacterium]|nr:chloride channel protein [Nitrospinota bacterium]
MDWKEIGKSLVSQGVPLLGGILGGPAGAVAGKMVAGIFDSNPSNPEELLNAIQSDPEAITKLREFEMTHKQKLQELQLEETKAFLADMDSARSREVALAKATGKGNNHLYVMAYIVLGSFFGIAGYLFYKVIFISSDPSIDKGVMEKLNNNPILMIIIGALISGFTQVLSYFFGSSKGSSDKNSMMQSKG